MPERKLRTMRAALSVSALLLIQPVALWADSYVVDKVYHPYVNPLEREFEFRSILLQDDDENLDGSGLYRVAFAHAFAERWRGEFYLIAADRPQESFALAGYELELKWQLTEQGEYFSDWGMLFEFEHERDTDIQELRTSVLTEKEFGILTGTLNLSAVYEWGDAINNEFETELAAQLRYRYAPLFEPAIELYVGQAFSGVGPVALGSARFGAGRKLRWELGVILGVNSTSPDQIWRAMLEYEF